MARAARWVYEGVRELRGVSPQLDTLIDRHGAPPWGRPIPVADRFPTLARGIAYQQLAGAAARVVCRLESGFEFTVPVTLRLEAEQMYKRHNMLEDL